LDPPSPIGAIEFRMEQMNLNQTDIAPLFGGKTRVSEVLNGKRVLTLKMITLLNRYLGIPLESLIQGNKEIKLDAEKRKMLLNLDSVREYLKNNKTAIA
jgi:HTH-type transcriptional regulator / antitoxin HigA